MLGEVDLSPVGSLIDSQTDITVGRQVSYSSELQTDSRGGEGGMSRSSGALTLDYIWGENDSKIIWESERETDTRVGEYWRESASVEIHRLCFYWTNLQSACLVTLQALKLTFYCEQSSHTWGQSTQINKPVGKKRGWSSLFPPVQ